MPIRIVIADDHAVFRSGVKALLDAEDEFEVAGESASGSDTVEVVMSTEADVLLLDISMPGVPAARVAETLLQERPGLAIVVLTMHEDVHYLEEFLKIGVRGYVLKKSGGPDLFQAIRAAHNGHRYVDPSLAGDAIAPYLDQASGGQSGRLASLTPREREVLTLLAHGHTNREIGDLLHISVRTVEVHRKSVMSKLGLKGRAQLVRFAIDHGLVDLT